MTPSLTPIRAAAAALLGCWRYACLLLTALVLVFGVVPSVAEAKEAESARKVFDVPAGPAATTLKEFITQSGVQLLYAPGEVKEVRTRAVKGEFTPGEAIGIMLAETKLVSQVADNGAISVSRALDPNVNRAIAESSQSVRPDRNGRIELDEKGDPVVKLDTFEVFGRKTLNMDIRRTENDTQPYIIFDRQKIQSSGVTTLTQFLTKSVTSGSLGIVEMGSASLPETTFNLRGLGIDETLILVDGRRTPVSRGNGGRLVQFDLNSLPLASVERIEILPSTASGIYGGNATGGVVNIILRRDYSGFDIGLDYSNAFDTDVATRRLEFSGGLNWENGRSSLTFSASIADGNDLLLQDRNFRQRVIALNVANIAPSSALSIFGSAIPPVGATTNIRSVAGTNLTLKSGGALNSSFTSVPSGYAGPASDDGAGLLARAGQYNLDLSSTARSDGGAMSLYSNPRQRNYSATFRREMTDWLTVFLEGSGSKADYATLTGPLTTFILQPTDIGNPFNQQVRVVTPLMGTNSTATSTRETSRIAMGAIFKLPEGWKVESDVTWDRSSFQSDQGAYQQNLGTVASLIASGSFNVFRDSALYPLDYSPHFGSGGLASRQSSDTKAGTVRFSGQPLSRWLRNMALSGSIEYREETYDDIRQIDVLQVTGPGTPVLYPGGKQSTDSYYAEVAWPIFESGHPVRFANLLELVVAGRLDRYRISAPTGRIVLNPSGNLPEPIAFATNEDQSANPTISVRYKPSTGVMLRASYGTGFLPPSAVQLSPGSLLPPTNAYTGAGVQDPLRGNQVLGTIDTISGGNPFLRPETSTSKSVGIVLSPSKVPGFRFSVDWVRIDKTDAITSPPGLSSQVSFQQLLSFAPERIIRGAPSGGFPVGPVLRIDRTFINATRQNVEALDFACDYTWKTAFGKIAISARATNNLHFVQQLTPVLAEIESADTSLAPRWRSNGTIAWEWRNFHVNWSSRALSSYYFTTAHTVDALTRSDRVPAQCYHDVHISYRFPKSRRWWLSDFLIQAGVNNVFNTDAPIVSATGAYAAAGLSDPRMTNYTIAIKKSL